MPRTALSTVNMAADDGLGLITGVITNCDNLNGNIVPYFPGMILVIWNSFGSVLTLTLTATRAGATVTRTFSLAANSYYIGQLFDDVWPQHAGNGDDGQLYLSASASNVQALILRPRKPLQ